MVVFHSSGITARTIEIPSSLIAGTKIVFKDDFTQISVCNDIANSKNQRNSNLNFRKLLKSILASLGLFCPLENDSDYTKLKPWLISIRGHYTNIQLTRDEVLWVSNELNVCSINTTLTSENTLCIHFRLGDLLQLKSKSYISVSRLRPILSKFPHVTRISLFSDSPADEVSKLVGSEFAPIPFSAYNIETIDVLRECLHAQVFVGTNSKISLWVCILRLYFNVEGSSLLPEGLIRQCKSMTIKLNSTHAISSF